MRHACTHRICLIIGGLLCVSFLGEGFVGAACWAQTPDVNPVGEGHAIAGIVQYQDLRRVGQATSPSEKSRRNGDLGDRKQ